MQIHGGELLEDAKANHAELRKPLEAWRRRVAAARWASPQDVLAEFGSADILAKNRVIFDIKGNRYRLVVQVGYRLGIVVVLWVGTHAGYDDLDIDALGEEVP